VAERDLRGEHCADEQHLLRPRHSPLAEPEAVEDHHADERLEQVVRQRHAAEWREDADA